MLRKEEILERTSNGLSVFKHYISGNWRIGRNFLNPLYEDNKASCNIYFDRRSGIYKMKDFGNDSYSGDCFFFVGRLKGLDCNNSMDFVEILETIDRDLGLGLATGNPIPVTRTSSHIINDMPEETWKTDAVPAVGDIVIVDKESISPSDRIALRKTPSNQAFKWADEEDDSPALNYFDYDTEMVVKKRTWKFDSEDEEMVCILKVIFLLHEG